MDCDSPENAKTVPFPKDLSTAQKNTIVRNRIPILMNNEVQEGQEMDKLRMMGPFLSQVEGVGKGIYFGEYSRGLMEGYGEYVKFTSYKGHQKWRYSNQRVLEIRKTYWKSRSDSKTRRLLYG